MQGMSSTWCDDKTTSWGLRAHGLALLYRYYIGTISVGITIWHSLSSFFLYLFHTEAMGVSPTVPHSYFYSSCLNPLVRSGQISSLVSALLYHPEWYHILQPVLSLSFLALSRFYSFSSPILAQSVICFVVALSFERPNSRNSALPRFTFCCTLVCNLTCNQWQHKKFLFSVSNP